MPRPNIVLFMPDQLRADAVGAFRSPGTPFRAATTPHIDALAARGTSFTDAFSQHSVCGPSRVSLMTGWYPHVMGHRTLTHLLKPWEPNLLKLLKEAGYNVAWVGQRGDTFAPGVTRASTTFAGYTVRPRTMWMRSPFDRDHRFATAFYHGRRDVDGVALDVDEATVQTAEAWLADAPEEPWLLFVALVFPHPPFEIEEPWFSLHDRAAMPEPVPARFDGKPRYMKAIHDRYRLDRLGPEDWAEIQATYLGMVARVDHHLGRVLEAVDRAGAADNTVTAFFTDHGEYLGDFGLVEKWPSGVSDPLIRNPVVLAGPGIPQGEHRTEPAELIDLMPTLLELAEVTAQHTHFGRSLLSGPARDAAYAEGGFLVDEEPLLEQAGFPYHNKAALQHEDPTLVGKVVAMRTEQWTYIRRLYEPDELYDRQADPNETTNVAGQPEHESVERQLRDRMLDWLMATSDVIPWDADPRFDPEL